MRWGKPRKQSTPKRISGRPLPRSPSLLRYILPAKSPVQRALPSRSPRKGQGGPIKSLFFRTPKCYSDTSGLSLFGSPGLQRRIPRAIGYVPACPRENADIDWGLAAARHVNPSEKMAGPYWEKPLPLRLHLPSGPPTHLGIPVLDLLSASMLLGRLAIGAAPSVKVITELVGPVFARSVDRVPTVGVDGNDDVRRFALR
jgi:hypothetical protein